MNEARVISIQQALLERCAIIVPAYNEGAVIRSVLAEIHAAFPNVICVDDGSGDETFEEAKRSGVRVLHHGVNVGQGGALETGIQHALNLGMQYFITMDADGQHRTEDALLMLEHLVKNNLDIVLGSRFLKKTSKVPFLKSLTLKMGVLLSKFLHDLNLTDTHNGLRAFNAKAARVMRFEHVDMAHASEVYEIIRANKLRYQEFPVEIKYTAYSMSKGQSVTNAINILIDFLISRRKR